MQQEKNKIVLDTNIIISAAISLDGAPAKIFELLLEQKIQNYTTKEIIEEIELVLERPKFKKSIDKEYKDFIISNFKKNSIIINPDIKVRVILEDEADDKFIECALFAKANIISGDKHLLNLKNYKEIRILSANEFLSLS